MTDFIVISCRMATQSDVCRGGEEDKLHTCATTAAPYRLNQLQLENSKA